MIKAEATVNGIISRSAMMKTGKDGKPFTAMTVKVDVTDRNSSGITIEISVGKDGYDTNEAAKLTIGQRVEIFSGFSTEKVAETFEFTWVRFVRFSNDECKALVPSGKVEIKGELELGCYQEKLNLSCRVNEISEWVKQQIPNTNQNA